jgi:SRSO17 transposase
VAEACGEPTPFGFQYFLNRADWDAEAVRDALCTYVIQHSGDPSWTGWYRHITLAMWALALLTVMRVGTSAVEALKKSLRPSQEASPLAAFKARRGLASC